MKQVRVNVRSVADAAVRREKRHGRDVIVVSSATLPDGIVMNGLCYPAEEIEKSYETLNGTLAPYGHPKVNGKFVSAKDVDGLAMGYIGAHNENARRENGRVLIDKVIYVDVANRSEEGKAVLAAIEKGEPIHTSTGLLCQLDDAPDGAAYKHTARNIFFDHDAILLNEEGAATPDQGVGMMVNAKGEEFEVINSAIDYADRDLDWAVTSVVDALDRREKAGLVDRVKALLIGLVDRETPKASTEETPMPITEEQFSELSTKVNGLADDLGKIGDTISEAVANAVKPLTDNLSEMQANQKAKDDAERAELADKLVKANVLESAEEAEGMQVNVLRRMVDKTKPGTAAPLGAGIKTNGEKPQFKLPEGD